MKKGEKSAYFGLSRVIFGHEGKLFSQTFNSHFIELEKLYNMCEIQLGPSSFRKNVYEILKIFQAKISSHRKYLINKTFLASRKFKCK